jgi:hypothetical protein
MRINLCHIFWVFFLGLYSCIGPKENPPITKTDPNILVIGNSITWHPPANDIGWQGNWGMAASAPGKDFFSVLESYVKSKKPDANLKRENVYPFERGFASFDFSFYKQLQDFQADILIIRFGENIGEENINGNSLADAIRLFAEYLANGRKMEVIITTTFWSSQRVNEQLALAAQTNNWAMVNLTDLGLKEENMAIGLFSNEGVARHPGDLGMERIAKRIFESLKMNL